MAGVSQRMSISLGEGAGAGLVLAVDAHDCGPGARRPGSRRPVPMLMRPSGVRTVPATAHVGGAEARQLRVGRAAQALAGGQQRDGLEQVGLARAVGTGEDDRAGADVSASSA